MKTWPKNQQFWKATGVRVKVKAGKLYGRPFGGSAGMKEPQTESSSLFAQRYGCLWALISFSVQLSTGGLNCSSFNCSDSVAAPLRTCLFRAHGVRLSICYEIFYPCIRWSWSGHNDDRIEGLSLPQLFISAVMTAMHILLYLKREKQNDRIL